MEEKDLLQNRCGAFHILYLYSTEELEKEANNIPLEDKLSSRMMYLDLLRYI